MMDQKGHQENKRKEEQQWRYVCVTDKKKCDPVPLNEALWVEYQNWEKYFIAINSFFYVHILMQKQWFSHQKLRNVEHHNLQVWYHSK